MKDASLCADDGCEKVLRCSKGLTRKAGFLFLICSQRCLFDNFKLYIFVNVYFFLLFSIFSFVIFNICNCN